MPVSPSSPGGPDSLPPLERGGVNADVQHLNPEKLDGAVSSRHRLRSSRSLSHSPQGAHRSGSHRRSRDRDRRRGDRSSDRDRERGDRDGRRKRRSSRARSRSYSPGGARRGGRSRSRSPPARSYSRSYSRSRSRSPPKSRHHRDRDTREFNRDRERSRDRHGGAAPFHPRYGPGAGGGFPEDDFHRGGPPPPMGPGGDPYGYGVGPYGGGGGGGLYGGPYGGGDPYGPPPSGYHGGISNGGGGRVGPSERRARGRRDEGPPGVSLLVRNVSPDITTQDLQQAFGRIGEVRDVYIPRDFHSQQPKGFAFVEYATNNQAREARDEMDRFFLKGRELEVVFAQEKRKTPNEMRGRVVDGGVAQPRGDTRRGGGGGSSGGNGGGGGTDCERSSSFERHKKKEKEQRDQRP